MSLDLKNLNKEQKEAVVHTKGPLLIVAGAGTGKTTVITQRIAYLIEKGEAKSEEILAVTFTEKAAGEMEERVDKLLDYGYTDLWISTFHAFCERVLRDHALDIGLPMDFKVLDETSNWLLLRQNLEKFNLDYYRPLGNPTKFLKALISHFSHCKDQEIYPENYLEYVEKLKMRDDAPEDNETERIKEVASAYHTYQRILLENSVLDFGDLINYCLKLFKKRPQILKQYQEKFKYILVDEFQDTNWAQYELIKMVASPKNNLTVCADDDQAIYRWRGASFSNIIQFKKDFSLNGPDPSGHRPKAKQVALLDNYRSCQNILDLSYKFIKQNDPDRLEFVNKINKKLVSQVCKPARNASQAKRSDAGRGTIEHIHARTLDEEVSKTIKKISEILEKDKQATYNDLAILVRANDAANPFIRALERAGLPYQFLASRGLYSKPAILDTISYFKLLDNYHESTALYRILNLPFLDIPCDDVMKLLQYGHKKARSLFETIEEIPLVSGISEKGREKINFISTLIKKHSALTRSKTVSEIFVSFLEDSGYLKYLINKNDKEQMDLLNQFLRRIKTFEESTIEPTLKNFMEEINLEIESGEEGKLEFDPEEGPDMIKVMTIHGAKGLEFKYVFLANMVDKRFPTVERKDPIELPDDLIKDIRPKGDAHLQEERRICYVAMTRAKRGLFFTSAEDYGGQRKKKLSRFMIEMGYQDKNQKSKIKNKNELLETKLQKPATRNQQPANLPDHFSYSQLAAFEKCPLQYKYNFILHVPVKGKAVFSFGKTMHAVLENFLKAVNETSSKKQDNLFNFPSKKLPISNKPTLGVDYLIGLYDKSWIDDWYADKKQKEEYYKLGKKILKEFYEEFAKNPPKILKIGKDLALEMDFNLKIGDYTIKGKIDRMDETKNGIMIIDYKTGNAKDKLDAEAKEQLLIYQIAAQEIFNVKPAVLAYFYVNEGKEASFIGTEEEIAKLKEKIIGEIDEIKKSNFCPTPGWQCSFCDFRDICDFAER